jgi:hypothetical protein
MEKQSLCRTNITMGNINYKGTGVTGAWSVWILVLSSCGSSATFLVQLIQMQSL